jgi:centrosomal protein CEP41
MAARKKPLPPKGYDPNQAAPPLPKTNYSKRYESAKAVVDSGMTVPKLIEQLKNRMPTGELFRRIRPKKLVELLHLHAYELEEKARLSSAGPAGAPDPSRLPAYMQSSIVFDDSPHAAAAAETVACPFLLLDVRDGAEFERCHIQGAQCYPKGRLCRATGQFSPEILSFRGQPNKMIVLYCDYGQTSGEAAQQFAEREFDNVFLLHGGIADFAAEFPELIGPGEPPRPESATKSPQKVPSPRPPPQTSPKKGPATRAAQASAAPPGAKKVWK